MAMKINICMLLGLRYDPKMKIVPQIGIASYITNFGHDVTWILSSKEIKEVWETTFNGVRVFVVPYSYEGNPLKGITKVLDTFRRMRFVFKNFKNERYNMIFVRDGVFDGLLALYIKRRYKIPFVFEIVNPIEQSWETRKFYSKHKCFWYLFLKIRAHITMHILRNADLVLPSSKWIVDDLATKKGIEKSKMMPFPNGVDMNRFSNGNGEEIRRQYDLNDSKVVVYVGTLDKMRFLDVLIRAFSKVKANKENVKLLMVGEGTDKTNLEKLANELGIENDVIFTGQIYFHAVPNFIAAADVGVSAVPPLDRYKRGASIKLYEYMAMGKPAVANEELLGHKEVVEESKGGILVKFEEEIFANGIIKLLDNPEKAKEMGKKAREWVMRNRTYEILARKLEKRYFDVFNEAI